MNPIQKLRRLFKGNPRNDFLSELYSKTSKPLFVHPQLGKALIDSYLKIGTPSVESAEGWLAASTAKIV